MFNIFFILKKILLKKFNVYGAKHLRVCFPYYRDITICCIIHNIHGLMCSVLALLYLSVAVYYLQASTGQILLYLTQLMMMISIMRKFNERMAI